MTMDAPGRMEQRLTEKLGTTEHRLDAKIDSEAKRLDAKSESIRDEVKLARNETRDLGVQLRAEFSSQMEHLRETLVGH